MRCRLPPTQHRFLRTYNVAVCFTHRQGKSRRDHQTTKIDNLSFSRAVSPPSRGILNSHGWSLVSQVSIIHLVFFALAPILGKAMARARSDCIFHLVGNSRFPRHPSGEQLVSASARSWAWCLQCDSPTRGYAYYSYTITTRPRQTTRLRPRRPDPAERRSLRCRFSRSTRGV